MSTVFSVAKLGHIAQAKKEAIDSCGMVKKSVRVSDSSLLQCIACVEFPRSFSGESLNVFRKTSACYVLQEDRPVSKC